MDIARHLPLSQRPQVDESGVGSNWAVPAAGILSQMADLLDDAAPEVWQRETARRGSTVGGVAASLVRALAPRRSAGAQEWDDAELVTRIRESSVERASGRPRTRVRALGDVLLAGYDIAGALGVPLLVDATTTGAVAVARSLTAPLGIRAVVRARTMVSTDHGWRVGFGPELRGSAEAIVLFLYGRGPLPNDGAPGD